MGLAEVKFATVLFGLSKVLPLMARLPPAVRAPACGKEPHGADAHQGRRGRALVHLREWPRALAPRSARSARRHRDDRERRARAEALQPAPRPARACRGDEELSDAGRGTRRAGGLVHADAQHDPDTRLEIWHGGGRRRYALRHQHQWRTDVRVRQGWPDPAHHADRVRRQRRTDLVDRGARQALGPAPADDAGTALDVLEIDDLRTQPSPVPDEARGLRPERGAQLPQPRHLRLRTHQLGRGARHRRGRDQAREARLRARRDHG